MRIFGSTVYVLDKNINKSKFDPRSNKGIFVGYLRETKGYRIWLPNARKIIIARNVKFLEKSPDASGGLDEIDLLEEPKQASVTEPIDEDAPIMEVELAATRPTTPAQMGRPNILDTEEMVEDVRNAPRERGRPKLLRTGNRGRPRKLFHAPRSTEEKELEIPMEILNEDLEDDVFAAAAEVSIQEAMDSNESNEWRRAIQSEVKSLVKNDTLKIITRQKEQNVIGSRLVLTNKYSPDGSI